MFRNTRELKFILPLFLRLGGSMNFDSRRPLNRQTIRKKASNLFSFVINWRSQNMYHAGSLAATKAGRNR